MREVRSKIYINMLGAFQVFRDGAKVHPTDFGSRKARELFRWLSDARNSVVPRDILLDALWPDTESDRMLGSFRVRVSEVRKLISSAEASPPLLERVDNGYILRTAPGHLETDADRFEHAATKALQMQPVQQALPLLEKGVSLYKGDYMSDDPYTAQWHGERERYRKLFITVAGRLAEVYEALGKYDDGIQLLQRLLAQPYRDEGNYRTLIRLQYVSGDQSGALHTFQECRAYLEAEHGAKPMPATLRLLKQVMRHEPLDAPTPMAEPDAYRITKDPAAGTKTTWPFLGRQAELTRLQQNIAALGNGQGGIVWLHGPSGIGKTRLLQEALASASHDRGFRTMWIQGSYLNSRIPFAATLDGLQIGLEPDLTDEHIQRLMESSSSHLRQLTGWHTDARVPTEPPQDAEPMRDVVLRQDMLGLFERLTEQMPLVCCIDDVHALDPASQGLWLALAKRIHRWPLLIVAASRRAPQQIDVGDELLRAHTPPAVIPLKPLSPAALRPLVGRGLPSLWTARWLKQLHAETGGEPLLVVAKLQALRQKNLIDIVDSEVVFPSGLLELITDPAATDVMPEHLPGQLDEFQPLWLELDDADRSLLQKAAALKDSLTLERLEQLADKHGHDFRTVLGRLIRQGFFTLDKAADDHTVLTFVHSRLQHWVYHTMARSERIWYHRRIFQLLQAEAEVSERHSAVHHTRVLSAIAFHALLAEQWKAAAQWSLRAATAAKTLMPGPEVVALSRQAFQAAQRIASDEAKELLHEARWAFGDALFHVGSYREAISMYEALTDVPAPDRHLVNDRLIMMYLHLNLTDQARRLAERAFKRAGNDMQARAQAGLNRAYIHYQCGELTQAIAAGSEAIVHLKEDGLDVQRADAHHQMALYFWDLGEYGLALKHATAGTKLRRTLGMPELISSLNQLGELYQDLFCTTFALEVHREALDLALSHGKLVLSIEIWRNLGLNFVHEGRMDKGLKTLERVWQQVQDLNLGPFTREIHLRSLLEAKLLAHQPADVRLLLEQYKEVIAPREKPFVAVFSMGLALLEGRFDDAQQWLENARAFWHQTGRRARATHVLLFAGQELMLHGYDQRAQAHLRQAIEEMERICRLVPPTVAQQIRASRQYAAARRLLYVT